MTYRTQKLLIGASVIFGVVLVGLVMFEDIWPSKASWREVCDRGYTQYIPIPSTTCTTGTCTTTTTLQPQYICLESHWTCRKGRDGSTKCSSPAPGRTW